MPCADALTVGAFGVARRMARTVNAWREGERDGRGEPTPLPYYARRGVRAVLPSPTEIIEIFREYLSGYMGIMRWVMVIGGAYVWISDIIGERDKTLHKGA